MARTTGHYGREALRSPAPMCLVLTVHGACLHVCLLLLCVCVSGSVCAHVSLYVSWHLSVHMPVSACPSVICAPVYVCLSCVCVSEFVLASLCTCLHVSVSLSACPKVCTCVRMCECKGTAAQCSLPSLHAPVTTALMQTASTVQSNGLWTSASLRTQQTVKVRRPGCTSSSHTSPQPGCWQQQDRVLLQDCH